MIKVLIVDDHPLFSEGLKSMFHANDGIEVVAIITNGNQAPSILSEIKIDVILMDIDMPIINGLETMDLIKNKGFNIPILMLTMHSSIRYIRKALEKGAMGYILKAASKKEVIEAINSVNVGKSYFHEKVSEQVFDYFRGKKKIDSQEMTLSERETEVVRCLADGSNSRQIGEKLFISPETVRTHRRNIMHKLHVKTTGELVHFCTEQGWI
jgi:DNA-binding NarL/FixJ family response regulator